MKPRSFHLLCTAGLLTATPSPAGIDYPTQVAPILRSYCAGCHNDQDLEGDFSVETYRTLRKGGADHGDTLKPGDSAGSFLFRFVTGAEKPVMPPKDEPKPTASEIAVLKQWIEEGAIGPTTVEADVSLLKSLQVPQVATRAAQQPISALAASADGKRMAVARGRKIEIRDAITQMITQTLPDFPGKINAVHFAAGDSKIVAAGGTIGLCGIARIHDAQGRVEREFSGHADALYDAELAPDGALLATAGYDQTVRLWNVSDGKEKQVLDAHKGAIFDLAWHPDGNVLASASADETVKLWLVATGKRLDTLNQPQGEMNQVLFSPDGSHILAVGRDKRIHQWQFVSKTEEKLNPPIAARFAHESPIVAMTFAEGGTRLVTTAEDRTVKWWTYPQLELLGSAASQPDQVTGFVHTASGLQAGRLDGQLASIGGPVADQQKATTAQSEEKPAEPLVGPIPEIAEAEPNNLPAEAQITVFPANITGNIAKAGDIDVFKFPAKAGIPLNLRVVAANGKAKSRLDSKLEILHPDGSPVEQVVLQAVRDSWFTFRGKDSSEADDFRMQNWMEMELDEYLYANGEVVKLWRYPRGPDSGFIVYPGAGNRWNFFHTSGLTHALNEPAYIVRPLPAASQPAANGLPIFRLSYQNDDASSRQLGSDSEIQFVPPQDGTYLARMSDVRGFGGAKDFHYSLVIAPRQHGFKVDLADRKEASQVPAGAGRELRFTVDRQQGFMGPIHLEITGAPAGFRLTTQLTIEQGQNAALGIISAAADAKDPDTTADQQVKIIAKAMIDGREVTQEVEGLGDIKLVPRPKLVPRIALGPNTGNRGHLSPDGALELRIRPGETISALVQVERHDFPGRVEFGNEDAGRNLPFGAFVDNIGLNGLLIVEGTTKREFFITASKIMQPGTTRHFHLRTKAENGIVSNEVKLTVE